MWSLIVKVVNWFLYMVVLTALGPLTIILSGMQAFRQRIKYEWKFLRAEYVYQYNKAFSGEDAP